MAKKFKSIPIYLSGTRVCQVLQTIFILFRIIFNILAVFYVCIDPSVRES